MLDVRACEVCGCTVCDHAGAHDDSNDERSEWELRDAKGPSTLFVERYWELQRILARAYGRGGSTNRFE